MPHADQLPSIDFSRIRTLKNTKHKGFEELAVQLFRSTFPGHNDFYRVDDAGGDGGVEDIAILAGNKKIGLQAKYFDKLGPTQWTQINKSVKTALKTHLPYLVEYRIATPVNRSKKSKTWDDYVKKWNKYALQLGYSTRIEFVWQGETELRDELIKDIHKSKVYYWFGCPIFQDGWLEEKFNSCKKLLDTRYTPKYHIRTDSEQILDAFFLTDEFIQTFFKKWKTLILACQDCIDKCTDSSLGSQIAEFRLTVEVLKSEKEGIIPLFSKIVTNIENTEQIVLKLHSTYLKLRSEKESEKERAERSGSLPFSDELMKLDKVSEEVSSIQYFIQKYKGYEKQLALVTGEAGTGKSHLLANSIERALKRKQPCLLLAGEQFLTSAPPLEQLCQCLGWEEGSEVLLGCLNTEAIIHGKPAILAIDALNECSERKLWKSHLCGLTDTLNKYPNIRLIVSCRSDFEEFILPRGLVERRDKAWGYIENSGFSSEVFEAVEMYFNGYNIRCDHFPPLLEEFSNPLFLKTFCEAYQGKSIYGGALSFDTVMKERIKYCQEMIYNAIDCPEYKVKQALDLVATEIANNDGSPVAYLDIRPKIDNIFSGGGESKSLYIHLRSNGMLVETLQVSFPPTKEPVLMVRFPYERFSDYFVAEGLLDLKTKWGINGLPQKWIQDRQSIYTNRGLLKMMAILVPERFGREFIELFKTSQIPKEIYKDFLVSLQWRTEASITKSTQKLLKRCFEIFGFDEYFEQYLRLITIPNHPFNAISLHKQLAGMELKEREMFWTIPISNLTSYSEKNTVNDIIRWAFKVSDSLISEEQAWLAAIFLTWLLTSNYKFLRYRATLALIKILENRSVLAAKLISEFHNCNDPYIVERVYAVACGVAMREKNLDCLKELSRVTYEKMFSRDPVPTHILQREYAQLIIERAALLGALSKDVDFSRCRPVFNSRWPRIMTEKTAVELEKTKGWHTIKRSIQPESNMPYGDFGRYVMDAAVHHFSNQKLGNTYKKKEGFNDIFPGMVARRYILDRVRQLGWSPESFESYERGLGHGRMRSDQEKNKVERISKKYQWIGLHELLGSLSDHYWMKPGYGEDQPQEFSGAWQLNVRDFDPSQPLKDPLDNLEIEGDSEEIPVRDDNVSWHHYPCPFEDTQLRADRSKWVSNPPKDFQALIETNSLCGKQGYWITLSSHLNWEENLLISQDEGREGQLKMWANIRCWLIKKEDFAVFLNYISDIQFYGQDLWYPKLHGHWVGEYPWAPSCQNITEWFEGDSWVRDCTIQIKQTVCGIGNDNTGFGAKIPSPIILSLMNLTWAGKDFDYVDSNQKILAFNMNNEVDSSHLFACREDFLNSIDRAGYVPLWAVLSERSCYSCKASRSIVKKWAITQRVYGYDNMQLRCYHNKAYDIPLRS